MFYEFDITVPANTPALTPVSSTLKLTHGVIHRVEVQFLAGCSGLVHAQIYQGGHQLYPTNPDGSFKGDSYVVAFDTYYLFESAPYDLKVLAWSDGTTYEHTITVRIGIMDKEILSPMTGVTGALKKFLQMVGVGG